MARQHSIVIRIPVSKRLERWIHTQARRQNRPIGYVVGKILERRLDGSVDSARIMAPARGQRQ